MRNGSARRVAVSGLLTSLMLVLGLIERQFPLTAAIPGIKLGLANSVLIYALYMLGVKQSIVLMLLKAMMSWLIYTNMQAMFYSLAGGVLSLLAMIALSRALTGYWWLLAILLFAACGIYLYASRTEQGKLAIGRYKLTKAPLRRLNALNAASQFASTMSTMLASGLPITRALDITASVATNYVFGLAVRKVKEGVEQGRSMVECMGEIPYFSKLLTEMTGVGERSGSMEETLEIVGDYFSNEVDLRSQRLLSALEPIITIVLAIVAVILLLGVYLPMFGMYGAM